MSSSVIWKRSTDELNLSVSKSVSIWCTGTIRHNSVCQILQSTIRSMQGTGENESVEEKEARNVCHEKSEMWSCVRFTNISDFLLFSGSIFVLICNWYRLDEPLNMWGCFLLLQDPLFIITACFVHPGHVIVSTHTGLYNSSRKCNFYYPQNGAASVSLIKHFHVSYKHLSLSVTLCWPIQNLCLGFSDRNLLWRLTMLSVKALIMEYLSLSSNLPRFRIYYNGDINLMKEEANKIPLLLLIGNSIWWTCFSFCQNLSPFIVYNCLILLCYYLISFQSSPHVDHLCWTFLYAFRCRSVLGKRTFLPCTVNHRQCWRCDRPKDQQKDPLAGMNEA